MRTIETALWPLEQPMPERGLGVFLGEEHASTLAGLTEGERVQLIEPNELRAEGVVTRVKVGDRWCWFAEIGSREAIQVISPEDVVTLPSTSAAR